MEPELLKHFQVEVQCMYTSLIRAVYQMANQIRAQQFFRYRNFHINKSQPLGHGAYGAVYKAKCDQLPCAAKLLHPTILDPADPGAGKIMQRFQQECSFLENIRHPNIVQYLGMSRDPESRLPVLLMELLDESLTKMLERSQCSLAYYVQIDICHDIALAVAYLHSNDIIHRDLSSNNVLIMAKSRAKVTDFGMSKLAGAAPRMTPLTMCPGTVAYMPPEALDEPPVYTKKLDCFSEGVIMIQVCTQQWPEPGPRTKTVQDSRSPTGRMQMPVLEPERRKNHIDMIDRRHRFLPIAMDCLHYQENKRPSSEELCQRLTDLKEAREYGESIEQVERVQNDIAKLKRQVGELQVREAATVQQLRDENQQQHQQLQSEIQHLEGEIKSKDVQLKQQDGKIQHDIAKLERLIEEMQIKEEVTVKQLHELCDENQHHQSEIQSKEAQIQKLKQQLEIQEQVTAEIQDSLQRQVEQQQQQLSQTTQQNTKPSQAPSSVPLEAQVRERQLQQEKRQSQPSLQQLYLQKPHPSTRQMTLLGEWRNGGSAPYKMARGAAVVDGNVAYFVNWNGLTCSYDSFTQRWNKLKLPKLPYCNNSLAVIRGLLTAIGGIKDNATVNKLLSIVNDRNKKWTEHFPPMPTKRSTTAAVTTKQHLIVVGGYDGKNRLDRVEVMDIQALVWSKAVSLPHPYSRASATICGDQLYMLGGYDKDDRSELVLTCSLTKLLKSCSDTSSDWVWHRITDVPVYESTCAAVNGELVAVGGVDAVYVTTSAVHKYNPTTDSWDIISNMPTARYDCFVTVLPTNEMMVVGGYTSNSLLNDTGIVEITSIQYT